MPRFKNMELSEREFEVAILLANGNANKVIANKLTLSPQTVKNHVTRILQKLNLTTRTEIALWLYENKPELFDQT